MLYYGLVKGVFKQNREGPNIMKKSNSKERIRELMQFYGINQTELCTRTGIQKSALSNYLNGDREPRQDQISLIVDPFNVNPAWLMGYDVPMQMPAAVSSDQDALVLSDHETKLVKAYRNASDDTQIAVCAVLGVKRDTELRTERSLTG